MGSDQLKVDSITDKGTVVHWFQLKAADEELAAELCMVLRYLPGEWEGRTHELRLDMPGCRVCTV